MAGAQPGPGAPRPSAELSRPRAGGDLGGRVDHAAGQHVEHRRRHPEAVVPTAARLPRRRPRWSRTGAATPTSSTDVRPSLIATPCSATWSSSATSLSRVCWSYVPASSRQSNSRVTSPEQRSEEHLDRGAVVGVVAGADGGGVLDLLGALHLLHDDRLVTVPHHQRGRLPIRRSGCRGPSATRRTSRSARRGPARAIRPRPSRNRPLPSSARRTRHGSRVESMRETVLLCWWTLRAISVTPRTGSSIENASSRANR